MTLSTAFKNEFYREILSSSLAYNTLVAYEKAWSRFEDYCADKDLDPLSATPDDVIDFLIELATDASPLSGKMLSMGTVMLYRSALNKKYFNAELVSPASHPKVNGVLKGLTRIRGAACRRVKALREYHIQKMLACCEQKAAVPATRLIGLRDAAIIVTGFAGALRRSEICGLTVNDITIINSSGSQQPQKMFITIRQSKTDQAGRGQKIAVPEGKRLKPVQRLRTWLDEAGITKGYVFQSMRRGGSLRGLPMHHSDVVRLVKHYAGEIGLDETEIAGHSLRAGFVTSAAVHRARLGQDHGYYPAHQSCNGNEIYTRHRVLQRPRRGEIFITCSTRVEQRAAGNSEKACCDITFFYLNNN